VIFIVQWQHETLVRDRFGGDKFWFKMIVPTAGLFGSPKHQANSDSTPTRASRDF
jgi:hypothetical protein